MKAKLSVTKVGLTCKVSERTVECLFLNIKWHTMPSIQQEADGNYLKGVTNNIK